LNTPRNSEKCKLATSQNYLLTYQIWDLQPCLSGLVSGKPYRKHQKTIVSCHRACNFSKRLLEPQVVSINAATVHHQTGTISSSKPLIQLTTVNVPEQVIDNSPTCRSQSNYIQLLPHNHANHGKSQFWDSYPTLLQSNSHQKHHPSLAKLQHYHSSLTPPRLQLCGVLVLLLLKLLLQTSVWTQLNDFDGPPSAWGPMGDLNCLMGRGQKKQQKCGLLMTKKKRDTTEV
jgi:hypothetical protein